jgi:hypothetical protein
MGRHGNCVMTPGCRKGALEPNVVEGRSCAAPCDELLPDGARAPRVGTHCPTSETLATPSTGRCGPESAWHSPCFCSSRPWSLSTAAVRSVSTVCESVAATRSSA